MSNNNREENPAEILNIYFDDLFNVKCESDVDVEASKDEKKSKAVCEFCSKVFSSKRSLQIHILTHTGEKPHLCLVCNKRFTQKSSLTTHSLIHRGKKPHVCDVCGRGFTDKSTLRKHCLIHSGEKPHVCDVCQRGFVQKTTLRKHYLTHTGDKPHECSLCKRRFAQKFSLRKHYLIHSSEKPYKCHLCEKSFSGECKLNRHISTHTSERKYVCIVCNKRFTSKGSLKRHEKSHMPDEKLHFCKVCNMGFKGKKNINQHYLIHKTEKLFHCNPCEKKVPSEKALKHNVVAHLVTEVVNKCKICNQDILLQKALNKHSIISISTYDSNMICKDCSNSFNDKNEYECHLQNQKPFVCHTCKQCFVTDVEFKQHQLVHLNTDSFICNVYNRSFNGRHSLEKPYRSHSLDRLNVCEDCGDSFVVENDYIEHKSSQICISVCNKK